MIRLYDYYNWGGDLEKATVNFDCGVFEINEYLREKTLLKSKANQESKIMLLADSTTIYGFISLAIDTIKIVSDEKDSYPVLIIRAIGIDKNHQGKG